MPIRVKKYFGLTALRNFLCLVLCALAFVWGGQRSSANIVLGSGSCRDVTIGPAMAFCLSVGECDIPWDYMAFVTAYMWNDTICPNFFPPVVDSVATDAIEGTPGIVGTARSITVPLGRVVALGFTTSQCSGLQGSAVQYFMANCQAYVPPPDICFVGCGGGFGGGGGGGCALDPFCGGGDGCSYCQDNWMWSAQCHDQWDTVCPL
jgi:hypothetical protein